VTQYYLTKIIRTMLYAIKTNVLIRCINKSIKMLERDLRLAGCFSIVTGQYKFYLNYIYSVPIFFITNYLN